MTEPGDRGGNCKRCGGTYLLIGHGHSVFGGICEECDLIEIMHSQDVTGGNYIPKDEIEGQ